MNVDYPVPIRSSRFIDVHPRPEPPQRHRAAVGRSEPRGERHVNALSTSTCRPLEVVVRSRLGGAASVSYGSRAHPDIAADDPQRFRFAPRVETVDITWTLEGAEAIDSVHIEVFTGGSAIPIYSRHLGRVRGELLPDEDGEHAVPDAGSHAWDGSINALDPGLRARFPGGTVNVAGAPYKVRLTIRPRPGARARSREVFTYVDVQLQHLGLEWGEWSWVDQSRPSRPDLDDAYVREILDQPRAAPPGAPPPPPRRGLEHFAFTQLTRAREWPREDPQEHEVLLTSNLFVKAGEAFEQDIHTRTTTDFREHRKLWGLGPRIPLAVHAWIYTSDGNATDRAVEALAGCRALWDWSDDAPDRWRDALAPGPGGTSARTEAFLHNAYRRYVPEYMPERSCNCPREYGGKYGDPDAPIFPAQDGTGAAPFRVDPGGAPQGPARRVWAALSSFGDHGGVACTGVLFQPSRMAGDRYEVSVYLYLPEMDCTEDIVAPDPVRARAGVFRVLRRVDVYHLLRGDDGNRGAPTADQYETSVRDQYRREMHLDVNFIRRPVAPDEYSDIVDTLVDRLPREAGTYNGDVPYPKLVLPRLLDRDPASGAAIAFKDWPDLGPEFEALFRNGTVYEVELDNSAAFLSQEEIVGRDSGVAGFILGYKGIAPTAPVRVLVLDPAQRFTAGEAVDGIASGAVGAITIRREAKCWGRRYTDHRLSDAPIALSAAEQQDADEHNVDVQTGAMSHAYDDTIDVTIGGAPTVRVTYRRRGPSRTIDTDLSDAARDDLRAAMDVALAAHAPADELAIELRGKWRSDRSKGRWKLLRTFIESLIFDRAKIHREVRDANELLLQDRCNIVLRRGAAMILIAAWVVEFIASFYPNTRGLFLLDSAGRTNLRLLPTLGAGFEDLSITGAAFLYLYPDEPWRTVAYVSSLAAGPGVSAAAMKTRLAVFAHEIAHALYLPHAPTRAAPPVHVVGAVGRAHVGGDTCVMNYDLDSDHFCGLCMLRRRGWDWEPLVDLEYHVELELGDPEDLFLQTDFDREFAERLQVLGLYARPVGHVDAAGCLAFCLEHAGRLFPNLQDATVVEARQELDDAIRGFLVEGGALPAPGQIKKIRIPGGFPTQYASAALEARFENAQQGTPEARPFERYMLEGSDRFAIEQSYHDANPALGHIPLHAVVKARLRGSAIGWDAAPPADSATVEIALVAPDGLPDYDPAGHVAHPVGGGTSFHSQVAPAPLADRTKYYLLPRIAGYEPDRTRGPEHVNAHPDVGGRRGQAPPFFKPRVDDFAALPLSDHEQAQAVTGADGRARIAFRPSRIGGDRYRLRVRLVKNVHGERFAGDLAVETGTMVRWRTARVSANVRMAGAGDEGEVPAFYKRAGQLYSDNLRPLLQRPAPVDLSRLARELAKGYVELVVEPAALNPVNLRALRANFFTAADALQRDFPRFNQPSQARILVGPQEYPLGRVFDPLAPDDTATTFTGQLTGRLEPRTLEIRPEGGGRDSRLAWDEDGTGNLAVRGDVTAASVDVVTGQVDVTFRTPQPGRSFVAAYYPDAYLDIPSLVFFPRRSPFLFNLRLPNRYNRKRPPGTCDIRTPNPGQAPDAAAFITARKLGLTNALLMQALVHSVYDNGGFLPGVALFTAVHIDPYSAIWEPGSIHGGKSFGPGVFVFRGAAESDEEFQALVLHEFSHSYYFHHAPDAPGARRDLHDSSDVCVMSYNREPANDGDMCGKCIASLRGMNIRSGPFA